MYIIIIGKPFIARDFEERRTLQFELPVFNGFTKKTILSMKKRSPTPGENASTIQQTLNEAFYQAQRYADFDKFMRGKYKKLSIVALVCVVNKILAKVEEKEV